MFENCHHVQHYTVALSQLSCLATFSHGKLALVNIFFFLFTTDLGGMIYCIVCIVLLFSTKMEAVPSVSRWTSVLPLPSFFSGRVRHVTTLLCSGVSWMIFRGESRWYNSETVVEWEIIRLVPSIVHLVFYFQLPHLGFHVCDTRFHEKTTQQKTTNKQRRFVT